MKTNNNAFNPIKEDKDGVIAKRMIWTSEALKLALKGLEDGRKLVANPFYENNTKLLKGDLVFQRTEEEKAEWKRCATDIIYFVNKYCKLMTPEGIKNVTLRDYQEHYLQHLIDNRLSIYLACRQCGKCVLLTQTVDIKINKDFIDKFGNKLYKYLHKNYYIINKDYYKIPFFEIYNLYDKSFKWKIQYYLYKIIYFYEQREKNRKN